MDSARAVELAPDVAHTVAAFDAIVFYRAQVGEPYVQCMRAACQIARVPLYLLGAWPMQEISLIQALADQVRSGTPEGLNLKTLKVYLP